MNVSIKQQNDNLIKYKSPHEITYLLEKLSGSIEFKTEYENNLSTLNQSE